VTLWFPIESSSALWPGVITIALVGLMESIAIAKQLAKKHGYKIQPGRELYGLGMSNLAASLFSGYPVTGSFSRSAVNNEAGAQSQLSGVVEATLGTSSPPSRGEPSPSERGNRLSLNWSALLT
jgi:MFS superfamily sulfate permease-like transporter